jgi:VWFA-related protein
MNRIFSVLFFAAFLSAAAFAQNPIPTPPKTDGDVVKISTSLIQIDATVTDKDGNIVTDLTADDFEVFENDEKQTITNLSFIALQPEKAVKAPPSLPRNSANAVPVPLVPTRLRPEQVRRTIALVVDDLGLSHSSIFFIRAALKKFVAEQMQEGDLVAVVTTSGGMGALQQFTSDKRILYAAIDKVKFQLNGREVSSFSPIRPTFKEELNASMNAATGETTANVGETGTVGNVLGTDEDRLFDIGLNQFHEDAFAVGTLGAVKYIIRGMSQLPGRKAVMLLSEGFNFVQREGNFVSINARIEGTIRGLTDTANRSGVIIYAVDPRGLVAPGFTAEDNRVGLRDNPFAADQDLRAREEKLFNTQQSLRYLTEETGGFAVINNNNINKGIQRMLNDQRGYYLIGYQPDEDTFDPAKRRFNKLTIKLKRPGLKIRYRSGFFGITDSEALATPKTPQQQLLDALNSPFATGQINLDLTTLFANDAKDGSFMRSFIHIKGSDLTFIEKDGWHTAKFEVLGATFGDNGAVLDTVNKTESIKARAEALREIQEKGLVYSLTLAIKKPGAYQMRVALRDLNSSKVGSANQFIEVPNLKKRMALSGLLLESSATREKRRKGENNIVQSDTQRDRAVRSFRAGTNIMFGASIYNAKTNAQPRLSSQFRIFRDNQEVFVSEESPLSFDGRQDTQSVDIGGTFGLGRDMLPGEYILQVIVKDSSKGGKPKIATQWIDFEVVK